MLSLLCGRSTKLTPAAVMYGSCVVAAVRCIYVLGLVFLNYPRAPLPRGKRKCSNGVADGIYNLSGGIDVIKNWDNSLAQAWQTNPNWFSSIWDWVTGGISAIVAGLITLVGYLILPFTPTPLFTPFLCPLRVRVLYVWSVRLCCDALIPSRGLRAK